VPLGPGRYGANAEKLIREFGTDLCVVLMLGEKGPFFDVATKDPELVKELPVVLREVAKGIEEDLGIRSEQSFVEGLAQATLANWANMEKSKVAVFDYQKAVRKDPIQLLQLGMMIVLDKPIYIMIPKGVPLSGNFRAVCHGIEEYEHGNEEDFSAAFTRLMTKATKGM
jgi:hypothetical protein